MAEKQCIGECKQFKDKKEFSKHRNNPDGLQKVCKECVAKYNQRHVAKRKKEMGDKAFLKLKWENNIRSKCNRSGLPCVGFSEKKITSLKFVMIDYPDRGFPNSLSHVEFIRKYKLTAEEYFFLREKIESGSFNLF